MYHKPPHTQEVYFANKTKLLLRNVEKIEQGNWTHIIANGGKEYIVNTDNVNFVKVYASEKTDYDS